ncbi:helicase-related protein [Dermacoccus nishinomiyaensis]
MTGSSNSAWTAHVSSSCTTRTRYAKKDRLFAECRSGGVDVLIGSTAKMGVGTNVQTRAVALHHLDCPWRPADLEQRDGRIIRQGNQNPEVQILQYVTKRSFDTYMWQTIERKARFIDQVMHGDVQTRSAEDIKINSTFNASEIKAVSSDNPLLLDKAQADQDLAELENLKTAHDRAQTQLRTAIRTAQTTLDSYRQRIPALREAITQRTDTRGEQFAVNVAGQTFTERAEAAEAIRSHLLRAASSARGRGEAVMMRDLIAVGGLRFDARAWTTRSARPRPSSRCTTRRTTCSCAKNSTRCWA